MCVPYDFHILLVYCSAFIITYSDNSEQICVVINICQTLKGCRQTFEG